MTGRSGPRRRTAAGIAATARLRLPRGSQRRRPRSRLRAPSRRYRRPGWRDGRSRLRCNCRRRLEVGEFAHQFLFEVDAEIVMREGLDNRRGPCRRRCSHRRRRAECRLDCDRPDHRRRNCRTWCRRRGLIDDRLRALRQAWVKAHDPSQFGKRIVVVKINRLGDFSLVAVSHSLSRTRTKPDARDAIFRPLPAQCGQKVTRNSPDLAHFLGRIGPDQRQTRRQDVRNSLHQP